MNDSGWDWDENDDVAVKNVEEILNRFASMIVHGRKNEKWLIERYRTFEKELDELKAYKAMVARIKERAARR